jgi:carotenoid cleavage dioxygenase
VANTNVVNHAGKTLALVESSLPYEITNELETLGAYDFGGKPVDSMTAHPKICPRTGELHFIGYGSLTSPYVSYHRANASGELIIDRGVHVPKLTMMHDFALSAEHIVLMDLPIVFRLDIARNSSRDLPYRWATTTAPGSECCAAMTHTVRSAGLISIRVTFFTSSTPLIRPQTVTKLLCCKAARYTELWRNDGTPGSYAMMWSWTINLTRGTVTEEQIDERAVEFPRIDDRLVGLPAR